MDRPLLFSHFEVILASSVIISAIFISFFLPSPRINKLTRPPAGTANQPINETSTWKTYSNPELGYSINYPPNSSIEDWSDDTNLEYKIFKAQNSNDPEFSIKVRSINMEKSTEVSIWEGHRNSKLIDRLNFTFLGFPAAKLVFTPEHEGNLQSDVIIQNRYSFTLSANLKDIDRLLSTFRFSNPFKTSETIDIKFITGTDISTITNLLPTELVNSIISIKPLVDLSASQLQNINASEMSLWMRVILKPETDSQNFIDSLETLPNVDVAEFASPPYPLP